MFSLVRSSALVSLQLSFDSLRELIRSITHALSRIQTTSFLQLLSFAQHLMDAFPSRFEFAPRAFILCKSRCNRNKCDHQNERDPPPQTQRPRSSLPLIHCFSSTFWID